MYILSWRLLHIVQLLNRPSIQFVQQTKSARHNDFVTPGNHLQETSEKPRITPAPNFWHGTQHATTFVKMQQTFPYCSMPWLLWHDAKKQIRSLCEVEKDTSWLSLSLPLSIAFRISALKLRPERQFQPEKNDGHVLTLSWPVMGRSPPRFAAAMGKQICRKDLWWGYRWPYFHIQRYPKASIYFWWCHFQKTLRLFYVTYTFITWMCLRLPISSYI